MTRAFVKTTDRVWSAKISILLTAIVPTILLIVVLALDNGSIPSVGTVVESFLGTLVLILVSVFVVVLGVTISDGGL